MRVSAPQSNIGSEKSEQQAAPAPQIEASPGEAGSLGDAKLAEEKPSADPPATASQGRVEDAAVVEVGEQAAIQSEAPSESVAVAAQPPAPVPKTALLD